MIGVDAVGPFPYCVFLSINQSNPGPEALNGTSILKLISIFGSFNKAPKKCEEQYLIIPSGTLQLITLKTVSKFRKLSIPDVLF